MNYNIEKLNTLTESTINNIEDIWEASVRATHDFLTEDDIRRIKPQVRTALPVLSVFVIKKDSRLIGFSGISGDKIEMLFLLPSYRGQGLGRYFIQYILNEYNIKYVDVNEQNVQGLNFYKRIGFTVMGKSDTDEAGDPFPILHMTRSADR